jgi:hypothetical protein
MICGPLDAQELIQVLVRVAAQAGGDQVTVSGGINGRKLELIHCNGDNGANTPRAAREGVQERRRGDRRWISIYAPQILHVLEKDGIPLIATTPVTDFTTALQVQVSSGAASALRSGQGHGALPRRDRGLPDGRVRPARGRNPGRIPAAALSENGCW